VGRGLLGCVFLASCYDQINLDMYVASMQAKKTIRLYRGEAPERFEIIKRFGFRPKERWLSDTCPGLKRLRLEGLSPDLIVTLASDIVQRHVTVGSEGSPFLSFTADRDRAIHYALDGGRRSEGLLTELQVKVVMEHSWEGIPEWSFGAFQDARGRSWLYVPGCHFPNADAITKPAVVGAFHANGRRDDEYLLLGDVLPDEVTVQRVHRRRRGPSSPALAIVGGLAIGALLAVPILKALRR